MFKVYFCDHCIEIEKVFRRRFREGFWLGMRSNAMKTQYRSHYPIGMMGYRFAKDKYLRTTKNRNSCCITQKSSGKSKTEEAKIACRSSLVRFEMLGYGFAIEDRMLV